MLIPARDFLIIEKAQEFEGITLPANMDNPENKNNIFKVKAVGHGIYTAEGKLIAPEVKAGDKVAVLGQVIRIPYRDKDYLMTKANNVIAYDRQDNL